MLRSLSILSRGRLSPSQKRALTLASLGRLELVLSPVLIEEETPRIKRGGGKSKGVNWDEERLKRLRQEDEEILAIIRTFMECQV